jgi:hypothetical protein
VRRASFVDLQQIFKYAMKSKAASLKKCRDARKTQIFCDHFEHPGRLSTAETSCNSEIGRRRVENLSALQRGGR